MTKQVLQALLDDEWCDLITIEKVSDCGNFGLRDADFYTKWCPEVSFRILEDGRVPLDETSDDAS